jgi:disulfide oxidoreductase YuzD
MSSLMLSFTYILHNDYIISQEIIKQNSINSKNSQQNTQNITSQIQLINKKNSIYSDIKINNSIFADSIKNLFDLVPNQITLHSLELNEDRLIIKGYTPTKDIYNYLFDVPLKSIFDSSKTTFYMLSNGQYSFLSINKFEKKIEENSDEE